MCTLLNRGKVNERVLAGGMREFAAELRLIDIGDLIAYVKADKFTHIDHLVSSAAEVVMKPGVVKFASSAHADLDWGTWPKISLDLEFVHNDVKVYFTLTLEAHLASVHINYMTVAGFRADSSGEDATRRLIEALEDAREPSDWSPTASSSLLSKSLPH
jgi:hypothetical protein